MEIKSKMKNKLESRKEKHTIIEEVFDYKGFKCVVILNEFELPHYTTSIGTKWRCGYVGVSSKHQLYKKDYSEIDELINIHGGLTFSGDFSDKKQVLGEVKTFNRFDGSEICAIAEHPYYLYSYHYSAISKIFNEIFEPAINLIHCFRIIVIPCK